MLSSPDADKPWWADEQYQIGSLSSKARKIQIVNTLTGDEHILEVGGEETVSEIQDRYLHYNAHAGSYTWKVRVSLASIAELACALHTASYACYPPRASLMASSTR